MEEEEGKPNDKNFQRSKLKKHTFQDQTNVTFGLKKNFDIIGKRQKERCYSTKLVRNFVPQIRPKKSFCKPTFFKLNDNDNDTKSIDDEDKKSELDEISSRGEVEEDSNNSSSLSSDEKEKDEEMDENDSKSDFSLEDKIGKNSPNYEHKAFKEDDNDEYANLTYKNKKKDNEEKNKLKNMRKEMSKIKSKSIERKSKEMEETINSNLKETFDLDNNCLNNNTNYENVSKLSIDINKKLNKLKHSCNNFSNFSILDVLSINEKN